VSLAVASWLAIGTTVAVVTSERALPAARLAVIGELTAIDRACSRFRRDSELSRVNAAGGRWVDVGPRFSEALAAGLRAAQLSDGAVDPTIGEALLLAGYDRDFGTGLIEPPAPLRTRRVPGWQAVRLDAAAGRVRVPRGVRLDLGATAKALAADRAAAAVVRGSPGEGVLVNLGGDIAIAGPAPPGGWRVRVTSDHEAGPDAPGQTIRIAAGALATSSTMVRRWGAAHHIIDPSTGRPAASMWRTVSVAAGSCVDANIASTAAIVLGPDAPAWLARRKLPSRLVDQRDDVLSVAGWPAEVLAE
jgi:thiamine biosynthesis lipoprotein